MLGGALCLDFTNTVNGRYPSFNGEYLNSYDDLLLWSARAGSMTPGEAQVLHQAAARQPNQAAVVLGQAVELREAMYHIFSAVANESTPMQDDLARLNFHLSQALGQLEIRPVSDSFAWTWAGSPVDLGRVLWPLVRSAADLLTSDRLNRVHECPPPEGCGWLFLDMSKNHSRRWCDMKTCGNAAKARRHYQRKRVGG